jgi:hypothetical protein
MATRHERHYILVCDRLWSSGQSYYRSRGLAFDSQRYQIFGAVVGLKLGPLSLVRIIFELLEKYSSSCSLENRD